MSSVPKIPSLAIEESVLSVPGAFSLHFGDSLRDVRLAWRMVGPPSAPVVVVLGGISAGRNVCTVSPNEPGWWSEIVGPDRALDVNTFRVLGIDFLGGSGGSTGPKQGDWNFPSISAYDQAELLERLRRHLGLEKFHAIVGASYGGMVALTFAERHPTAVDRIVVISAAHRAHPMATAWRSVQREIVRALAKNGDAAAGLRLARALAMATYRTPTEFAKRFAGPPTKKDGTFRSPVEEYLLARGQAYANHYLPQAFVCLSESIDLHHVGPENIRVPATLVAIREDQLVPLADIQELAHRLAGPHRLVELSSIYGHDAFLKESEALRKVFAEAL